MISEYTEGLSKCNTLTLVSFEFSIWCHVFPLISIAPCAFNFQTAFLQVTSTSNTNPRLHLRDCWPNAWPQMGKCPGTPHHGPWAEEVARTEASLSHIFTWKSVLNQTSVRYHSPFCLMGSSFSSLLWLQIPREMLLATFPLPTSSRQTTSAEVIFLQSSQFHGGAQKVWETEIGHLLLISQTETQNQSCCSQISQSWSLLEALPGLMSVSVLLWQHSTSSYLHLGHNEEFNQNP